jgi:hypothetical protein
MVFEVGRHVNVEPDVAKKMLFQCASCRTRKFLGTFESPDQVEAGRETSMAARKQVVERELNQARDALSLIIAMWLGHVLIGRYDLGLTCKTCSSAIPVKK